MEPSLTLFLAAVIFGFGFALGSAIMNGLIGLVHKP